MLMGSNEDLEKYWARTVRVSVTYTSGRGSIDDVYSIILVAG